MTNLKSVGWSKVTNLKSVGWSKVTNLKSVGWSKVTNLKSVGWSKVTNLKSVGWIEGVWSDGPAGGGVEAVVPPYDGVPHRVGLNLQRN